MRAIITGASSGIGAALARELSARGWSLALVARRKELLDSLRSELREAVSLPCDVSDSAALRDAVRAGESALGGPFDLAVANAGVGLPSGSTRFNLGDAEQMVRVNFISMLALFDAVIPSMVERRSGRFAGIASVAGLRGVPNASVYSATKAAMQAFLEASRVELKPHNVGVTIVNPGFVETPMIAGFKRQPPFTVKVGPAAKRIADGLERGERVVEFPLSISLLMRTGRHLPDFLWDFIVARSVPKRKK